MKFSYLKFPATPSEPFPDRKYALRPVLPILIKNNGKKINYGAIIDSGADHSVFHSEIGKLLGIEIEKGKKMIFWGTSGQQQIAYVHKITIEVGGWDYSCLCGFSDDINTLPYGLLGQDDFFKQFKIIFDYSREEFELQPNNNNS